MIGVVRIVVSFRSLYVYGIENGCIQKKGWSMKCDMEMVTIWVLDEEGDDICLSFIDQLMRFSVLPKIAVLFCSYYIGEIMKEMAFPREIERGNIALQANRDQSLLFVSITVAILF